MTTKQIPSWKDRRDDRPTTGTLVTHLERLDAANANANANATANAGPDPAPALASAEIRLAILARATIAGDAHRALRLVLRAQRTSTRLHTFRLGVLAHADDAAVRRDLQELRRDDDASNRLGRITSWVAPTLTGILGLSFVLNEVPFMYSTARIQFDIPASVAMFDLGNPSNALAIGLSILVPTVLFAGVGIGSRSLAWWLYPRARDMSAPLSGPEVTPDRELWNHIPMRVYVIGSLLVVAALSLVLHQLAVLRFEGVLFGRSSVASGVYVALITLLPAAMLLVATAAENPRFVHHRRVVATRWKRALQFVYLATRERQLMRRYEGRYLRAKRMLTRMDDEVAALAWRADLEYLDASTLTGLLPMSPVGAPFDGGPGRAGEPQRSIDRPAGGALAVFGTRFLPHVPEPSEVRVAAREHLAQLPAPTADLPLARQWRQLAQHPHSFWPADLGAGPTPHA